METSDEEKIGSALVPVKNDAAEEFSNDVTDVFTCQICLELVHKPVVNACGHMFCFLCVHLTMNHGWEWAVHGSESSCPLCRRQYMHFPRVCEQLHFFLLHAFPDAYRRRCKEAHVEEIRSKFVSPQFDDGLQLDLTEAIVGESSHSDLDSGKQAAKEAVETISGEGSPLVADTRVDPQRTNSSSSREQEDGYDLEGRSANCKDENEVSSSSTGVATSDLKCSVCNDLLCRPVVLNCGHVFCEECITSRDDAEESALRCSTCSSIHPGQSPSLFLELHDYLDKTFPSEYARRQREMAERNNKSCVPKKSEQLSNKPGDEEKSSFRIVHLGVGCDGCGMFPMIGRGFHCMGCERVPGYDLCLSCYESQTTPAGRFNQKHTREHRMVEIGTHASEDDEYVEDIDDLTEVDGILPSPEF
ncbi:hypothetical protein R1sor_023132 [Riccia sorocarpa]|uniref:E3 ubiquitin-protein ligase PRT1 n=1 Tax=Riccia sorocarpa TaxID=122646 RepID=A0ABD3GNK9_9MARC